MRRRTLLVLRPIYGGQVLVNLLILRSFKFHSHVFEFPMFWLLEIISVRLIFVELVLESKYFVLV